MALGLGAAARDGAIAWSWLLVTVAGVFCVEVAKNASGEVIDFDSGTDRAVAPQDRSPFSGGKRVLVDGLMTRRQVWTAAAVFYLLAVAAGLAIVLLREPRVLPLGVLGVGLAFFYHAPPLKLAYRGLGEIAVAVAYGPLIACGTYLVQRHTVHLDALLPSLALALLLAASCGSTSSRTASPMKAPASARWWFASGDRAPPCCSRSSSPWPTCCSCCCRWPVCLVRSGWVSSGSSRPPRCHPPARIPDDDLDDRAGAGLDPPVIPADGRGRRHRSRPLSLRRGLESQRPASSSSHTNTAAGTRALSLAPGASASTRAPTIAAPRTAAVDGRAPRGQAARQVARRPSGRSPRAAEHPFMPLPRADGSSKTSAGGAGVAGRRGALPLRARDEPPHAMRPRRRLRPRVSSQRIPSVGGCSPPRKARGSQHVGAQPGGAT